MRILTRYMLRSHVGPFLFALTVLTSLLFVNTIARRLESLAGKGLPISVILEVCVLSLPHIVALTLPMAVLVSVLYAFSQFAADNEITALKASGVNLLRLMVPLVVVSMILAGGMVWFNDRVLPESNHKLKTLIVDIAQKSPTFTWKEQVINQVRQQDMSSRYFVQAAQIDATTNKLRDVVIYDLSWPGRDRTVYADSGRMAFNRERTNLFLELYDGWVNEVRDTEPRNFQRVFFKRQLLELVGVGDTLQRSAESHRSDREMSLAMLKEQADSARKERVALLKEARAHNLNTLKIALGDETTTPDVEGTVRRTALDLEVLSSRARLAETTANRHMVEYHKKFAIPFACIVFVILGVPLAIRFPRGGVGMVIFASLAIFGIYYMCLIGGESLGDRGIVPPFLGPWAPNIVFLLLSIWGLVRIGRENSTARDGGWAELLFSAREAVTRRFTRRRTA